MEFKKKLKTRLYVAVAYIILGVLTIAATFITKTDNEFISAFGFALAVVGIARIRNYLMITKDEETIRKQQINETDERNVLIADKAKSVAFMIYLLALCTAVIILSFFNMHDAARWIAYSVYLLVAIYWIARLIYQKKL